MANIEPHRAGGFSYLWVLTLVAMMGLGLTVAAQVDATFAARERERELLAIGRQFRAAIESYHRTPTASGRPEYPRSLEDLLADPRVPGIRRHLRQVYIDPITGTRDWGLAMLDGRIAGVFSKSETAPLKRGNFDPDEQAFESATRYADWRFVYPPGLFLTTESNPRPPDTRKEPDPR